MTLQELGSRLKALREEIGVTQEELAERTGLNHAVITRLETGSSKLSTEKLVHYLNGLSYEIVFRHLGTKRDF